MIDVKKYAYVVFYYSALLVLFKKDLQVFA